MRLIIIIVCIGFTTLVKAQEKTYLPYFETFNMHNDYQVSTTRVFRIYLNQESKYQVVILPIKADSITIAESYSEAWNHAKELNATYFIKGELDRLGETVIVSVSLFKTEDGTKLWSDMLKAQTPDDLDPILLKIAKTLGTSYKASEATDIYSVTNYDSQQLKQVRSNSYFGVLLGGAFISYPYQTNSIPAGFGLSFSHDMRKIMADLSGETYFGPKAVYFFSINANVPIKKSSNTPYIGGGVGVGGTSVPQKVLNSYNNNQIESKGNGGLMLIAGGGYLINRTSNVRLKAGGKILLPLYTINDVFPLGVVVNIEIAFGK